MDKPANPSSVDATPEQVSMARRAVMSVVNTASERGAALNGHWDHTLTFKAALAAVIETTEVAARLAEYRGPWGDAHTYSGERVAELLRNNDHLKAPHP